MRPLALYDTAIIKVENLKRLVKTYKKWLVLSQCLGNISLYRHEILELPVSILT